MNPPTPVVVRRTLPGLLWLSSLVANGLYINCNVLLVTGLSIDCIALLSLVALDSCTDCGVLLMLVDLCIGVVLHVVTIKLSTT